MKYSFTPRFIRSYHSFSNNIQQKFDTKLKYLLGNLQHPSLRTKKFDEAQQIWQARVDRSVRFYFLVEDDTYILLDIKRHTK